MFCIISNAIASRAKAPSHMTQIHSAYKIKHPVEALSYMYMYIVVHVHKLHVRAISNYVIT